MEPVRPHVDAFVLNLARTRTFSAKDFAETREGACRLASSLAQELAPTMATWAKLVAPYAEAVARHVARLAKSGLGVAAPIGPKPWQIALAYPCACGRSRRPSRRKPRARCRSPRLRNACRSCGAKLAIRKRLFCDQCLPDRREEAQRAAVASFRAAGPGENRQLCARPVTIPPRRPKRSAAALLPLRSSAKRLRRGGMTGRWIGVDFRRDILPKLQACRCA